MLATKSCLKPCIEVTYTSDMDIIFPSNEELIQWTGADNRSLISFRIRRNVQWEVVSIKHSLKMTSILIILRKNIFPVLGILFQQLEELLDFGLDGQLCK